MCPGGFICDADDATSECIPLTSVCDGVIDCRGNNRDEKECTSGAYYDAAADPFESYYGAMERRQVWSSIDMSSFLTASTVAAVAKERSEKSWIDAGEVGGVLGGL